MKTLFIVLSIFSAFLFRASATTLAWDVIELTSGEFSGTGADRVWHGTFSTNGQRPVGESGAYIDFYISFVVTRTASTPVKAQIAPDTEFQILDGPESNWILANEGDLVDESTSRHLGSYFFNTGLDEGTYGGSGLVECRLVGGDRFYLGFATGVPDWDTGEHASRDIFYGWALFECRAGALAVVRSAVNAEGGGIYVGTDRTTAVPEPASGALALLGALLLLRRRRAVR